MAHIGISPKEKEDEGSLSGGGNKLIVLDGLT
jgi:hypothetical protein